jgi:predicted TIM-barrel fold metal-dependent hydrolase
MTPRQSVPPSSDEMFLPEPEPREVKYTIISVDDHLVEPRHMFEGRLPQHLKDRAPKVVETPKGHEVWEFEGQAHYQAGMNAVVGRRRDGIAYEPFRFDQMRPGCYDVHARIADMDVNGVWASVNFPSMITGFCGRVFSQARDRELGLATTKAWNDWFFEEWYSEYPTRLVPMGITFLTDPDEGAREIRRNAERGFTAVSLPDRPQRIGLPSLYSGYWDPVVRACADTETVISLHTGSSGQYESPADAGPRVAQLSSTLFGQLALAASVEWLWSGYPVTHPNLKIAMSEGGIGWVAMLIDRLDNICDRSGYGLEGLDGMRPADVLRRNFWFCTIEDPSTIDTRYTIGVENICIEVDYPHGDSNWPDTQAVIEKYYGHLPAPELRKICCENAARLYRVTLPDVVLPR